MELLWIGIFVACFSVLAYHRASLSVWTMSLVLLLFFMTFFHGISKTALVFSWLIFLVIFTPLQLSFLRRKWISKPILAFYRKIMPTMSRTEREALAAGTVTWEGDLFRGNPSWEKLLAIPAPQLTAEEQAFIDGPVETLCNMTNDWDITHNLVDLPSEMWKFIKENGFFGLIIPKEYGGKEFSAFAHSQILIKLYGRSSAVASTVAVPNSLGPAELLLHYGTPEQKNYYLPRLARGEDVPCFALTGPNAGSDAGSMTDTGVICWGEHEGKNTLGIRLNFNKRYITLAPVATVIGLAFKLYDPEHLLGAEENLGITCALIPRNTSGMIIGRRHFPANIVFQNGPIHGKDVFIPVDWIIGGSSMAGHGWRMLMECLAAGRAISLPAGATGGAKVLSYATGAYARVRHQFNVPIGKFEGVQEVLARIAGHTYMMDAARTFTAGMINLGEKPAIASAIIKYHVTEMGRQVTNDGMDIHGGKGICLGPKNYLGRSYQAVPIAITVEGANILTRNMIIFGQGAMRCHPYIFAELEAANESDPIKSLTAFDKALFGHMSFTQSNLVRSIILGLTHGRVVRAPGGKIKHYFQQATRFSSAFALAADVSLLVLGGGLKRKESISARLGDILSYLYLLSTTLKHYHDQGCNTDDLPIIHWASQTCLYQIQEKFRELLQNFPNRLIANLLKIIIFPLGSKAYAKPTDKLNHEVAELLLSPTGSRDRLSEGAFKGDVLAILQDAFLKSIAAEPIEKIIKSGDKSTLSPEQLNCVSSAEEARQKVIAVDDFAPEELRSR